MQSDDKCFKTGLLNLILLKERKERHIRMTTLNITLPHAVEQILHILTEHGHEAYIVGGCVRDAVLGRIPNDWDITTSAKPEEVKKIFKKTVDTGILHGTVTVIMEHEGYEVTTYRIDGEYQDGRHPVSVEFTGNLVEDLKRRDFTINAMAYNPVTGIVDVFEGTKDLEKGIIRCVGNPLERFQEDALRMLRGIRFSAELGFEIEAETFEGIKTLAPNIEKISKERIQVELEKLLMSPQPEKLGYVYTAGLSRYMFTELERLQELGKLEFTLELLRKVKADHVLRWGALLLFADGSRSKAILKELRFDNHTIDMVSKLVTALSAPIPVGTAETRRSMCRIGTEIYPYYIGLEQVLAREPEERLQSWEQEYQNIIERQDCISLKQLAVNGEDVIAAGVPRGARVGEALERLLDRVLECPDYNDREKLINIIKTEFSYNVLSD